jgi:PliI/PliC-like inhibitor of I-type lysozyme
MEDAPMSSTGFSESHGKTRLTTAATLSALAVCVVWSFTISLGCRVESRVAARGAGSAEKGSKQAAEVRREQTPGENPAHAEESGAFNLESAGIRAHVLVPEGEGKSIGTYLVHIALPGGTQEIREERDGVITGAWLEDLDGDGELDLTVATTSAGSGSYPTIHYYRQERQTFELRPLKDLTEAQRAGYMGHDTVTVHEGKLLRIFPKYLPNDSNSSPSGGTVTLRYSFTDDGWISP